MNARLKKARNNMELSQSEAAKRIGISTGMLAMLETGDRKGSDDSKLKISNFYKFPVGYLFLRMTSLIVIKIILNPIKRNNNN